MQKPITRIRVDPELRDRFLAQFPGHGSLSWLLETSMKEMLAITAGTPDATELVRASIRGAVLRERRHRRQLAINESARITDATVESV